MLKNSKATLLRLSVDGTAPVQFQWAPVRELWVKRELSEKQNLFSRIGIGARGAVFEVYRLGDISLQDAISWRGQHHFISQIEQESPAAAKITTAIVDVVQCAAKGNRITLGALNRPITETVDIAIFPGVITEKYTGWAQQEPQVVIEKQLVLVTPKPVLLESGDVVTIGDATYNVRISHLLDTYKNEYDIARREDV